MKSNLTTVLALLFVVFLFTSCGAPPAGTEPPPTVTRPPAGPTPLPNTSTPRPTRAPIETPTPVEAASPAPTKFILVRATPVDEDYPLDSPLSIERLRQGNYPGSAITFEGDLGYGENYGRYYVSYVSEGLKIYALMTVPIGEPPEGGWPVIIFNHGYIPPDIYKTTERYEDYVDALAQSGYIVFRPDYRGHDRSDGEARGAYGFPDYTIDVLNAVASMKAYPDANPKSIGMWGHSMGGYITLRCMVISKDIKAGVIWAGVVAPYPDMVYNWPGQSYETPEKANNWRTSLASVYGTPSENPALWDTISANSYLTELSGPIQLHHATGDVEVPVEFSISLYEKLRFLKKPAELYIYKNDNHNLSNSFEQAMFRTIEFFDAYLK